MDHIEWDLLSPLTPEDFAKRLCVELGLSGEAIPLIAHAIHEELLKHKKDAIEWGVIGGDVTGHGASGPGGTTSTTGGGEDGAERRTGAGGGGGMVLKDKTGLGLGWGRTPRDSRGPRTLQSVWREWSDAEEFRTRFEELTAEEVERRDIERERASRYTVSPPSLPPFPIADPISYLDDCVGKRRNFRRHGQGDDERPCVYFIFSIFVLGRIAHIT